MEDFIRAFEEALEIPPGQTQPATRLADISKLDSMGRLSVMAMADSKFGILLEADQLDRCQTVADLHAVLARPGAQ